MGCGGSKDEVASGNTQPRKKPSSSTDGGKLVGKESPERYFSSRKDEIGTLEAEAAGGYHTPRSEELPTSRLPNSMEALAEAREDGGTPPAVAAPTAVPSEGNTLNEPMAGVDEAKVAAPVEGTGITSSLELTNSKEVAVLGETNVAKTSVEIQSLQAMPTFKL